MLKNRTIITLIISAVVMLATLATLVFFFKIIANKNEHTSAVLVNLANKVARKENINTLTKKIAEVEETKETIDGYFVDSTSIDSFIDYLEKLGANINTEVKVENFEISSTEKNILLVRLSNKGSFTNVMRMIVLLENAPYQIRITRTSINQLPQSVTVDEKTGKATQVGATLWQSTISFSILIS
ncbi:MAG: hypothetical protein AAB895_03435 [Patescibacteria group bacterium]